MIELARLLLLTCAAAILFGCAAFKQTTPDTRSLEQAWERAKAALAQSPYSLTSVDETGHVLKATFTATDPSRYTDCGKGFAAYRDSGGETLQEWGQAEPSISYKITLPDASSYQVEATRTLTADIELRITGDAQTSKSDMLIVYWLEAESTWSPLTAESPPRTIPDDLIRFTTTMPGTSGGLSPMHLAMACVSLGVLEKEVRSQI